MAVKKSKSSKAPSGALAGTVLAASSRTKVLLIPSAALMVAAPAGPALASTAALVSQPTSTVDLLERRRRSLTLLAETVLYQSGVSVAALRHSAPTLAAMTSADFPTAPPKEYTVLEALGTIIANKDDIDSQALQASGGWTVLENVLIPMAPPASVGSVTATLPNFWHLNAIRVAVARSKGLTGKNVLAGVLDTGIDAGHPEFAGKKVYFAEFDMNGNLISTQARDAGQHGTHVCGLIAGKNAGVAPSASLAVAAVLTITNAWGGMSGGLVQIARGLNWLLTNSFRTDPGVDVVSASLCSTGYNNYLYQSLANARISPGTGMIAAIGNNGANGINNHGSPGNYDIVLGIGAVDNADSVAPFSDWGTLSQPNFSAISKPDMSAPGVDVYSSVPGGGYAAMSGTSMATPIVTGAAALALDQAGALSFDVSKLFARLMQLTRPFAPPLTVPPRGGSGILDLTNI